MRLGRPRGTQRSDAPEQPHRSATAHQKACRAPRHPHQGTRRAACPVPPRPMLARFPGSSGSQERCRLDKAGGVDALVLTHARRMMPRRESACCCTCAKRRVRTVVERQTSNNGQRTRSVEKRRVQAVQLALPPYVTVRREGIIPITTAQPQWCKRIRYMQAQQHRAPPPHGQYHIKRLWGFARTRQCLSRCIWTWWEGSDGGRAHTTRATLPEQHMRYAPTAQHQNRCRSCRGGDSKLSSQPSKP